MIRVALDVGAKKICFARSIDGRIDDGQLVNDPAELLKFFKGLATSDRDVSVVMESTGVYHLHAAHAALKAGLQVMVVSPRQSVNFARVVNTRSKTDRVDARMLLQFLERMPFEPWTAPKAQIFEIREISRYVAGLSDQLTEVRNQLHACQAKPGGSAFVVRAYQQDIRRLELRIEKGRAEAMRLIQSDPQLKAQAKVLESMVGVAEATSIPLLAELSMLPTEIGAKACAAHAGLDVRLHESGSSVQKPGRISKQGNAYLRRALYMPALVAVRHDPAAKAHYEHLVARGKAKLQAITAVMRKMLTAAWSMMKTMQPYDGTKLYQIAQQKA